MSHAIELALVIFGLAAIWWAITSSGGGCARVVMGILGVFVLLIAAVLGIGFRSDADRWYDDPDADRRRDW